MTNHPCLGFRSMIVLLAATMLPLMLSSQVRIKERVEVQPSIKKAARLADVSYFEGNISPNNSHQLFNVVRSCEVEAVGTFNGPGTSIMIIMSTGENLTNNTATRKIYCTSTLGFELWTWTSAGIVVENITGSISGGSATYSISGYQSFPRPMNVPFTATVTFTASYCADFDLAGITLSLNAGTEIVCGGVLPVQVNAFDAGGRMFCDQSSTQVTVSLSAKGNYVFLQSGSQSGSSITFPLSEGAFSVVLDPTLGFLPDGADTAHISVQAGLGQASTDIKLRCVYQPPTVRIEFPSSTSPPVYVSEGHQPVVQFTEVHTPANGALEPEISWSPASSIDTREYFAQLQDSIPLSIPVSVTATNLIGTATDNGILVLMKRKDVDRFVVTVTPDTIAFGDFVFVSAMAVDSDGNEVMLDDNTTVNLAADPSDAGVFYPGDAVTYGELKSGYVVFVSMGTEPVSPQDVGISVSDAERSGTGKVVITSPPCVVVQMSEPRIGPGGQSEVKIWALQWDGRLKPYSEGQMFEVSMNVDESVGRLRSGWGEEGSVLFGPEPFVFIAADSLATDSAVVEIQVFASSGGVVSSVRDGDSEVLRTAQKAAVAKLERILSAQTASAEGMRIAKKTAGVSTVQSAKRDGGGGFLVWRAGSKSRTAFDGEVCNPMAQVVVSKVVEPQLVVLDPIPGTLTSEISADPQMPSATLRAQLRNFNKGSVEYHWTFYTKWVGPDGREFFDPFDGTSSAQNSDPATWEVNWDGRIRGGNDLSVRVVAIADGVSYEARIENLGTIKGVNPSVAEIKAGLNLEEQVVVYMESKPKWTQFTASGYPSWGKPHGYGLMQLDNPRSTDEQVWNWRANKQAGTAVYSQKRRIALAHPRKVREQTLLPKTHKNYRPAGYRSATDFSSEELLKDAFQLYNGGYFWDWKPEDPSNPNSDGTWGVVAKPLKGHSLPHGAEAWNVYKQVQDATNGIGTYPDKWNDR